MILQARMAPPFSWEINVGSLVPGGENFRTVKRCSRIDEIVLAIPNTSDNLPLQLGEDYSVKVFSGSENDLLDRFYQAMWTKADHIVRLLKVIQP